MKNLNFSSNVVEADLIFLDANEREFYCKEGKHLPQGKHLPRESGRTNRWGGNELPTDKQVARGNKIPPNSPISSSALVEADFNFSLNLGGEGIQLFIGLDYIKTVIYRGTQNNVLLFVRCTTIIHIQKRNKVVGFLMVGLFTMPRVWKILRSIMIDHY
jgi:hypothetical protein